MWRTKSLSWGIYVPCFISTNLRNPVYRWGNMWNQIELKSNWIEIKLLAQVTQLVCGSEDFKLGFWNPAHEIILLQFIGVAQWIAEFVFFQALNANWYLRKQSLVEMVILRQDRSCLLGSIRMPWQYGSDSCPLTDKEGVLYILTDQIRGGNCMHISWVLSSF